MLPVDSHVGNREPYGKNTGVFKKARPGRPQPLGRTERTWQYVSTGKGRERRWPACRAYSAEVASATKAGSSGAGTAAFFNTP
jgi:hypothetical protein